jgi:predicted acylesterase/phospholipase RssA
MPTGISEPIDFQLAIQGGGARLADLIAALEIIQQYEKDGLIRITRICGASAGAIAGAILACGNNSAARARDYLHANAHLIAKQLLPDKRGIFSLGTIAWKLWRGQPICAEETIQGELRKLFEDLLGKPRAQLRFSSLPKTLMAVTTDVDLREPKLLKDPKEDLVKALFDSSAFPLVLKGARQLNHPFVDGGLCENLPSDNLVGEESKYGNVLAISFPDRPRSRLSLNTFAFIMELFSTAINNSIKRASAHLPTYAVLEIASDINIFDFSFAFDKNLRRADMELIKIKTKEWLEVNINANRGQVVPLFKDNPAAEAIMAEIFQCYEAIPPHRQSAS